MNGVVIRNALLSDVAFVSELEKKTFSVPWDEKSVAYSVTDSDTYFFIAECSDEKAGYISAKYITGELDINNVAVSENYRKKGIGSALLKKLIDTGIERHCEFITLEVRESNTAAINLYKKFGFVLAGKRKSYYTNPAENALIYTKFFT